MGPRPGRRALYTLSALSLRHARPSNGARRAFYARTPPFRPRTPLFPAAASAALSCASTALHRPLPRLHRPPLRGPAPPPHRRFTADSGLCAAVSLLRALATASRGAPARPHAAQLVLMLRRLPITAPFALSPPRASWDAARPSNGALRPPARLRTAPLVLTPRRSPIAALFLLSPSPSCTRRRTCPRNDAAGASLDAARPSKGASRWSRTPPILSHAAAAAAGLLCISRLGLIPLPAAFVCSACRLAFLCIFIVAPVRAISHPLVLLPAPARLLVPVRLFVRPHASVSRPRVRYPARASGIPPVHPIWCPRAPARTFSPPLVPSPPRSRCVTPAHARVVPVHAVALRAPSPCARRRHACSRPAPRTPALPSHNPARPSRLGSGFARHRPPSLCPRAPASHPRALSRAVTHPPSPLSHSRHAPLRCCHMLSRHPPSLPPSLRPARLSNSTGCAFYAIPCHHSPLCAVNCSRALVSTLVCCHAALRRHHAHSHCRHVPQQRHFMVCHLAPPSRRCYCPCAAATRCHTRHVAAPQALAMAAVLPPYVPAHHSTRLLAGRCVA
ncbi:hypothetical protein DENSPDRAFT_885036 [Dentipellis sp. KUC8613]|nr:hypothetical protein DENSPDRAFT_885036 [Dentipellis sp. KUC8613]